jgi:hypothetical protein
MTGSDPDRPAIVGLARLNLGYLALSRGDSPSARRDFESAREWSAASGDGHVHARSLAALASVALNDERVDDAFALLRESFGISVPIGDKDDIAWALHLSAAAWATADASRAATLLGAAEALRESLGGKLEGVELAQHERALSAVRSRVDPSALSEAWNTGHRLSLDEAVQLALR